MSTEYGLKVCQYIIESRKRRQTSVRDMSDSIDTTHNTSEAWQNQVTAYLASIATDIQDIKKSRCPTEQGVSLENVPATLADPSIRESQECWLAWCPHAGQCYLREMNLWDSEIAHRGLKPLQEALHTYFTLLCPEYPCIDETSFNTSFGHYTSNARPGVVTLDSIQFVVMTQLLVAKVDVLESFSNSDETMPGWNRFLRAHHVMHHIIRDKRADIATLQCLVISSLYLLYVGRVEAAYDNMGIAVRLIFQLRLHDPLYPSGLSEAQILLRTKLLYSVYILDRKVSYDVGGPGRLDENFINVPLSNLSSEPFLVASISWARLLSCVDAAVSTVEAVYACHQAKSKRNIERYTVVTYLPTAMKALSAIILSTKSGLLPCIDTFDAFEKGVQLLDEIAPGSALGRRAYGALKGLIKTTTEAISDQRSLKRAADQGPPLGSDVRVMECSETTELTTIGNPEALMMVISGNLDAVG
ncbi:hypothetical protein FNAPI_5846 [Fusarium napiforme]|uniref:Xylanolytic transcriptional activator regulatory domain-containing protein n=1 Tax=Fusarium napiforme TaxID=42672 RepID=A0A8H5JL76_9HYPO|nr:hypothetical protein FNAPI_5846 [Fusarium napiforme]